MAKRVTAAAAALTIVCALALAPTAGARANGWVVHTGRGFTVSLPASWLEVPGSRSATLAYARKLHAEGQTKLAEMYASIYEDKYQWGPAPLFHAFQWPLPPTALSTDIVLKTYSSGGLPLQTIAKVLVTELKKESGGSLTIAGPVHLQGTAEDCYRILTQATLNKTYNAKASYNFAFLYEHGQTVYNLTLRTEAGLQSAYRQAANRIASSLRFNS